MQPRVSEAARLFVVAAFLVLVASGPTFSGRENQLAATTVVNGGVCTTCGGSGSAAQTNEDKSVPQTVQVDSKGNTTVTETGTGKKTEDAHCSEKNKAADPKGTQDCPKSASKTAIGPDGKPIDLGSGDGGMVSSGSGGGPSNPSAVAQYAGGNTGSPYLMTPPSAEGQRIIDSAFPGVSDGSAKLAYPVSQTENTPAASDSGTGTVSQPQSDVPGTALDYSQSLNKDTIQRIAALTPPSSGVDEAAPVRSYLAPSGGATLGSTGYQSVAANSPWNQVLQLGGIQSPISPAQVFFSQPITSTEEPGFLSRASDYVSTQLSRLSDGVQAATSNFLNGLFPPAAAEPARFVDMSGVKLAVDRGVQADTQVQSVNVYGLDNEKISTIPITETKSVDAVASTIAANPGDFLQTKEGQQYGGYIEMVTPQGRAIYDPSLQGSDSPGQSGSGFTDTPQQEQAAAGPSAGQQEVTQAGSSASQQASTQGASQASDNAEKSGGPAGTSPSPAQEKPDPLTTAGTQDSAKAAAGLETSVAPKTSGAGQGVESVQVQSGTQSQGTGGDAGKNDGNGASGGSSDADQRTAFQKFFGIYPQAPTPQSQLDAQAQARQEEQYAQVPQSTGGVLSNLLNGLLGISPAAAQPANNQVLQKVVATFQGIASCYDPTNKTSCGGTKYEGGMQIAGQGGVYLPNIPAAALKLPLALQTGCGVSGKNCQAIITNTDTGKSIQVTINDNGPLTPGRVIDLNPVARTQLGGGDLSRVRVDILSALGTSAGAPSQGTASFSVTIPTSLPGTRQDASAANAKVSSRGVSLCVGTTGCAIDANSYVNSLCQPDTGCAAKQLGSQPDKNYNERSMSDAAERAADYKRQIEKVGANISGSRPVLFDNCQYSGTCGELIAAAAAWNAAHPNAQIQPMINNPVLVAEKLGRDATVNLLNSAAAAGGGGVWEPGGGSVAENAALRGASKFPSMPLLAVGTAAQMQTVGRIINTLGLKNIGTSVSSQTEGGSGYRDGTSGAELTLPPTGFVQQGLAKYADELAKQGLTPGLPSTDGGAKLLTPKEYAQLSAEDKSRAELYKQIPLQQGVMNADQLKSSFVQNGARYSSMGTVEQARTQIENGAKAAVAREFFKQDFTQDPRFKALQAQGKIPIGGGVRTFTAERVVSDAPAPVAAPSRLFNADKYPGINPVVARSMDAASRLLPPGYTVEVISASRSQGQSDVGARSLHIQRDQNGNSKAVDVTIRDAQGKKLCNFQCPQTFKTYQQFMQNVKAYQDQLFPDLAHLGRWGGYFVSGNWNDLMHYDLGPKSDPRAGSWEQGLYQAYARYGLPGDVGGGMGPIGAYPIPPAGTAGQEPQYVIKDGDTVVGTMSLPPGALGPDGQVVLAVGSDGVPVLDKNGRPVFAAILPDVGKVEAKVNATGDAFSVSLEHTPPTPPQTDTRTTLERVRDAAGQALADADQRVRDAFGQIGSQQPGPGAVPANNSRPAGGAPAPSSSGTPAPVQQQRPSTQVPTQQRPVTTAVPAQGGGSATSGSSGSAPVLSVSGGGTARGGSGETFSCTPGTVVNGASATPVTIAWKCPAGTASTGTGFSTLGTNAGTITTVVSTTSSLVTYKLSCGAAMQTLSCSVKVLHPKVILVAKPAEVAAGERVSFSWSGTDVDTCALYAPPSVVVARGGASGDATSLPFTRSAVFRMQCAAGSATTTTAVTVRVQGDTQTPLDTTLP